MSLGVSAGAWLVAATMAHLDGNAAVDPLRVFDLVPDRAVFPWAQIEDPVLSAQDGAGVTGRVGTLAITARDGGERPARLRGLVGRMEEQMAGLPSALSGDLGGGGWRLTSIALARSRIVRVKDGWAARSEWAVRVFRLNRGEE